MDEDQDWTMTELAEASYAAGQAVASLGDFNLLVANVAIGYRDAMLATGENNAPPPVYTGTREIVPSSAVVAGPHAGAAQEQQRRESVAHYRQLLVCLDALRPAIEEMVEECIDEGRRAGMVWTEIADALDVTPQAVSKRYRSRASVYNNVSSDITEIG